MDTAGTAMDWGSCTKIGPSDKEESGVIRMQDMPEPNAEREGRGSMEAST